MEDKITLDSQQDRSTSLAACHAYVYSIRVTKTCNGKHDHLSPPTPAE